MVFCLSCSYFSGYSSFFSCLFLGYRASVGFVYDSSVYNSGTLSLDFFPTGVFKGFNEACRSPVYKGILLFNQLIQNKFALHCV